VVVRDTPKSFARNPKDAFPREYKITLKASFNSVSGLCRSSEHKSIVTGMTFIALFATNKAVLDGIGMLTIFAGNHIASS